MDVRLPTGTTEERCQSQQRGSMTTACSSAGGKENTDLPRFWLASCLMRLNCFFIFFSSAAPSVELGKVNGASLRKRSTTAATSRPSLPKETRKSYSQNFNAVHQVLHKGTKRREAASRPPSIPVPDVAHREGATSVGGRRKWLHFPTVRRAAQADM